MNNKIPGLMRVIREELVPSSAYIMNVFVAEVYLVCWLFSLASLLRSEGQDRDSWYAFQGLGE
jgi:hypothetical protein